MRSWAPTRLIARPLFPTRPVRPARWMYCSGESGVEKMKTWDRSSMSIPREATSVVTRWWISPVRKPFITDSRFFWGRSDDNMATGSPRPRRKVDTRRVSSLVLQKIIEEGGFSYSMSL